MEGTAQSWTSVQALTGGIPAALHAEGSSPVFASASPSHAGSAACSPLRPEHGVESISTTPCRRTLPGLLPKVGSGHHTGRRTTAIVRTPSWGCRTFGSPRLPPHFCSALHRMCPQRPLLGDRLAVWWGYDARLHNQVLGESSKWRWGPKQTVLLNGGGQ